MAALTCDVCGGNLVVGSGGIAVCDSCGIVHSQDRMKEKIQGIKGANVPVDNSRMIDTWLRMGTTAAEAKNYQEAYEYFTKVVEVDPKNWRAVFGKGEAGAYQSTIENSRIPELYQGIRMALKIIDELDVSEKELIDAKNEFAWGIVGINNNITHLMDMSLLDIDDLYYDTHRDQMWDTRQRHLDNIEEIEYAISLISDLTDDRSKRNVIRFKEYICEDIRDACEPTRCWEDYSEEEEGYYGMSAAEKKPYLDKYWKLVEEIREVKPDYSTEKYEYPDPFNPGFHSSQEIFDYWKKDEEKRQERKKEKEKKKRFDEYWEEHSDEKVQYEERIRAIDIEIKGVSEAVARYDSQIAEIRKDLGKTVPEEIQLAEMEKRIKTISEQRESLCVFALKQKKQLRDQIEMLQSQVADYEASVKQQKQAIQSDVDERVSAVEKERKPLLEQIASLNNEKSNINNELTMER